MKKIILSVFLSLSLASSAMAGWFDPPKPSSDAEMAKKAEQQNLQIDRMVGFPSVVNGFEKRMVRMLYELRDDPNYNTYTYLVSLEGKPVFLCKSVGFGINASIQFSNPQAFRRGDGGQYTADIPMPQAEPNGLFMPEGLAATYVMCVNEQAEELQPVYVEPEIIVSPFPLN